MQESYTERLRAQDRQFLWHPFTQMQDWRRMDFPIIERARGIYLYDTDGNRYLDGVSSLWVNVHGHRKRELDRVLREQLKRVAHTTFLGLSNVPATELASELVAIAPPGLSKVFYSDSGSTAVEIALKMAFQYWSFRGEKRTKFVTFDNAYHGDTIGSVSVGGIDLFHRLFHPLLFPSYRTVGAYCYRCSLSLAPDTCQLACLDHLDRLLAKNAQEVAAVILEPEVQGAAGMLVQPAGYVRKVRDICRKHKVLLIFDEVATGFGRTGKIFAAGHSGVTPDLMALAKGITGGYLPLAATLATNEIYETFLGNYEEFKTFFHGHTYTANPLACAVARENIRLLCREEFLVELEDKVSYLKEGLAGFPGLDLVGDIRQKGLMVGIELVLCRRTKEEIPPARQAGHQVILEARRRGVILRPLGNVVVLMPPLAIRPRELKKLLDVTFAAIKKVGEKIP
jgi:adenosylmethionine-8-amino-7-oxononanoate aminotransferase